MACSHYLSHIPSCYWWLSSHQVRVCMLDPGLSGFLLSGVWLDKLMTDKVVSHTWRLYIRHASRWLSMNFVISHWTYGAIQLWVKAIQMERLNFVHWFTVPVTIYNRSAIINVRFYLTFWFNAHLTYLQWPFKVKNLFDSLWPLRTFFGGQRPQKKLTLNGHCK